MTHFDFDITFCNGEAPNKGEENIICPVREKCHRFWTEEYAKEATRLGEKYLSFMHMATEENPIFLEERGCRMFWPKGEN